MSKYIVLDTETTGLEPQRHAVIEIAALVLDENLKPKPGAKVFQTYVRPHAGAVIDSRALAVNKQTWVKDQTSETWGKANTCDEAWFLLRKYLTQHFQDPTKICIVGWNPSFDSGFLRALQQRTQQRTSWPFHYHLVDLIGICRFFDATSGVTRRSYKLGDVHGQFTQDQDQEKYAHGKHAHTAVGDIRMSLDVLELMYYASKQKNR